MGVIRRHLSALPGCVPKLSDRGCMRGGGRRQRRSRAGFVQGLAALSGSGTFLSSALEGMIPAGAVRDTFWPKSTRSPPRGLERRAVFCVALGHHPPPPGSLPSPQTALGLGQAVPHHTAASQGPPSPTSSFAKPWASSDHANTHIQTRFGSKV